MGEYERKYPEAPTQDEINKGYAPSTIRGTPFVKFLFWTFAGLAITYVVTYGVTLALQAIQEREDARYASLATRGKVELKGPRLQPSPGHEIVDWRETNEMYAQHNKDLAAKGWIAEPQRHWKMQITDEVVRKTAEAMKRPAVPAPATQPVTAAQ
jgi:hypothetical protein